MWVDKLHEYWMQIQKVFAPPPTKKPETKPAAPPAAPPKVEQPVNINVKKEASMNRKALVVGVDKYRNPSYNLRGCTMDAAVMSGMLQDHFGFPGDSIRVLMDDRATKAAMEARLDWLVRDAQAGDVLVFFYAGHGAQVRDRDGDELDDQKDEILCPHDMDWDKPLTDDILHTYFVRVPQGVNLSIIFDCCHSGTATRSFWAPVSDDGQIVGDVKYRKVRYINAPLDIEHRARGIMLTTRPLVKQSVLQDKWIFIAAAQSNQQAEETQFEGQPRGAFSYNFGAALKRANWKLTYREAYEDTLIRLKDSGFVQIPQLEAPDEYKNKQLFGPVI